MAWQSTEEISMGDNSNQQKKVLLLTALISLAIHASIILVLNVVHEGRKIDLIKKTIEIKLVEIKTNKESIKSKPKPNKQPLQTKKRPQPIRQLKPRIDKQIKSKKTRGEPDKRKQLLEPELSVDTGLQTSKKPAIAASDTNNTSGSESGNKSISPISFKESTSILPKETPRCRQCREPRIPRRAEKRGEEGYAVFRLYVSASGKVVKVELLKSSGHSGWNNAARKAAMSSSFYPMALQNTKDVTYIMKSKRK